MSELPDNIDDDTDVQTIPRNDFESELSERYLEQQVQQAEILNTEPREVPNSDMVDKALFIKFGTVSGMELTDQIPMPETARYDRSDLITLFEFTGADPGDTKSLHNKRVPTSGGSVDYEAMRQVLAQEEAAVGEWDAEKRLEKVGTV